VNYYTHGRRFLADPYFLAGTAVPDWLNVADRRVRVRRKHADPFAQDANPQLAALAGGIVQHHCDDAWFHETRAFHELSLELTLRCRDALPPDEGFRPSFLGHILVEILLDAALIDAEPQRLADYYQALSQVDPQAVQDAVNRMTPLAGGTARLAPLIRGFCDVRFLFDYASDSKLHQRLNQVMLRVGLPELPSGFAAMLPAARRLVAERQHELLLEP
jgi:hypothetical protein